MGIEGEWLWGVAGSGFAIGLGSNLGGSEIGPCASFSPLAGLKGGTGVKVERGSTFFFCSLRAEMTGVGLSFGPSRPSPAYAEPGSLRRWRGEVRMKVFQGGHHLASIGAGW